MLKSSTQQIYLPNFWTKKNDRKLELATAWSGESFKKRNLWGFFFTKTWFLNFVKSSPRKKTCMCQPNVSTSYGIKTSNNVFCIWETFREVYILYKKFLRGWEKEIIDGLPVYKRAAITQGSRTGCTIRVSDVLTRLTHRPYGYSCFATLPWFTVDSTRVKFNAYESEGPHALYL